MVVPNIPGMWGVLMYLIARRIGGQDGGDRHWTSEGRRKETSTLVQEYDSKDRGCTYDLDSLGCFCRVHRLDDLSFIHEIASSARTRKMGWS
jgi:hypothetical protein